MNNIPLLSCENLKKIYKNGKLRINILKNVFFTLHSKEIVGIFGKSGSGKSTFLHLMAGLDVPTSGSVFFKKKNISELSSNELSKIRNKEIGFIYQFHHLLMDFNVVENVMIPSLIFGVKKKKSYQIAKKVLTKVGLKNKLNYKPYELSGGERQRVAVARAVVNNPSVVLADEPTGNLDNFNAQIVFNLLRELNEENKISCVIVTHDLNFLNNMTNKIEIIDGRLIKIGNK